MLPAETQKAFLVWGGGGGTFALQSLGLAQPLPQRKGRG